MHTLFPSGRLLGPGVWAALLIGLLSGCDYLVVTDVQPDRSQAVPDVPFQGHDPSALQEIAPDVFALFSSSNPDYDGRLRQFVLNQNEAEPAWRLVEHWPRLAEREDMAWHVAWMEQYGYDPATQIEHTELATVAPTFLDGQTVYFHLYNNPGRAWAAQNGLEPAMFAGLYRATASGAYPNQTWTMDPTPVYYSNDTTWTPGGPRAVDAQVWRDAGELLMTFGSWDRAQQNVIAIAELDDTTGRIAGFPADEPAFYPPGGHPSIHPVATFGEGAFSLYHGGMYYLFLNLGNCCSGLESTYEIVVGRSAARFGPYMDDRGRSFMDQYAFVEGPNTEVFPGRSVLAGVRSETPYIGPGHTGLLPMDDESYCLSFHFYDGNADGTSRISTRRLTFDDEGWPEVTSDESCTL